MRKALVIGINDYPRSPLKGCINDAKAVCEVLKENENGTRNFDVVFEEDVKTKGELLSSIDSLFKGKSEIALLYFSGHGFIDERGGFLVTPDFSEYDYGVSMSDILSYANMSKCENKIIILDCCHAGALGTVPNSGSSASIIGEGVTLLTASKDDESAMEIAGHGVFTNLLLEALKGGAANIQGKITPGSVYAYIDQALGAWQQRPVFKTNITQFVSIRDTNPSVRYEELKVINEYFKYPSEQMKLDPSYEFTNDESIEHEVIEPFADDEHVRVFKILQKLEGVGLVKPVGEEHMYFAAMKSKSCMLTPLGQYYWQLLKEGRI